MWSNRWLTKCNFLLALVLASVNAVGARAGDPWLTFAGADGPGKGKHIVLISGDEEYRSEQALPQLAKILSQRHGFRCTVLFAIDPRDGTVNPEIRSNIPGLEALEHADLMVLFTRFRNLPEDQMRYIANYVESGRPILGMRTATHAFDNKDGQPYGRYGWQSKEWDGGFGRQVLGETWISHHGEHGKQSTRGILAMDQRQHPILRGLRDGDIWGPTDVYGVRLPLPRDCISLVLGQVLQGMKPTDKPVVGKKNDPMLPIAWVREVEGGGWRVKGGSWRGHAERSTLHPPRSTLHAPPVSRVFTTTMGASQDLQSEGLRRLLVNACYWLVGLEDKIPARTNVDLVGSYLPHPFGFGRGTKGKKPSDYAAR